MLTMTMTTMMTNANNANANAIASAALAEEEEQSDSMSMMCSEEEDEESEDDGEELDGESVYVSLIAVADRMERWYMNGACECPEDHVIRVEALLRRERATNVFETRDDNSVNVGGSVTAGSLSRQLAERLEAEKARPRGERRSLGTIEDLQAQAEAIAERIQRAKHVSPAHHWAYVGYDYRAF